jgi:FKBP-type peptidyl-prolyl cis-trans isomerase
LALLCLYSCTPPQHDGFLVSPTRVSYKFHRQTGGMPPSRGDVLLLNMLVMTEKGDTLPLPMDEGFPAAHVLSGAGMLSHRADPILSKASVGDSLTLKLPASVVYSMQGPPKGIGAGQWLYCHLGVREIKSYQAYQRVEAEWLASMREKRAALNDSLLQAYAAAQGWEMARLESGVYARVDTLGGGQRPLPEQQLSFHYRVSLLDGTPVDESYKRGKPFSCIVGRGEVIEGLDRTWPLLPIGTKATLLIPSDLAYGEKRMGKVIPPNANLRFDVWMLEAK